MASNSYYDIPASGAVFTFGRSRFADNLSSHFFVRNDPVLNISCGDEHTALICESGRVFLFGKNDFGQLGFGHTRVINKPSCLKFLKPFKSVHVACGKSHTLIATACDKLFAFGCNSDGQLGIGDFEDRTTPQILSIDLDHEDHIIALSAGCHHSAFLTGAGNLYLWGDNSDGQCGEKNSKAFLTPQKIEFPNPISSISCGYYHTAFLSLGNVYTFGENDNGKLGRCNKTPNYIPGKVKIEENCVSVHCGGSHTIILADNGKAYAFGSNFSGQLGVGNFEAEFPEPQKVRFKDENIKLTYVTCGESHSAFVSDQGMLYTCGDARNGKLCNEDDLTNHYTPKSVDILKNFYCSIVSCGGCHTMVVAKVNKPKSSDATTTLLQPINNSENSQNNVNIANINNQKWNQPFIKNDIESPNDTDKELTTESTINEQTYFHEDEIFSANENNKINDQSNNDLKTRKLFLEMEYQNTITKKKEFDFIDVDRESAIKKFFKKLTRRKILNDGYENENNTVDNNTEFKGHQTSKACNIL